MESTNSTETATPTNTAPTDTAPSGDAAPVPESAPVTDPAPATDLERREFTVVRRGYDPEEVRTFLRELAEAGLKPSPVFEQVGGQVAELLETTHRISESIETQARERADALLADAEAAAAELRTEAEQLRTEAEAARAAATTRATEIVADAETIASNVTAEADRVVAARLEAVEDQARERATTVIEGAKRRLRKLLDAEREVHARLVSALSSVNADPAEPLDREDEQLLDQAFAEFFGDDVEIEPSRSWILSE